MRLRRRKGLLPSLFFLAFCLALTFAPLALAASGSSSEGDSSAKLWDLLWRTMNFTAVVVVLVIVLKKPISQTLRGRTESIKDELEGLEAKKDEAQRQLEETLARLENLEAEKEKILAGFKAQGENEKARILSEAETMAQRIKEQARLRIEQEITEAKAQLTDEIAELSVTRAMELVKKNINSEDQKRLMEESLNKMVG